MSKALESTVRASLSFDFRGQSFQPSIAIDLHTLISKQQQLDNLHDLLAASIGLDSYRHEYDVLMMEEIVFSEPTGLACEFISDGHLDFDAFSDAWHQQHILFAIQPIAERHLNISDLLQYPDIQQALIESYKAGQQNPQLVEKEEERTPPPF